MPKMKERIPWGLALLLSLVALCPCQAWAAARRPAGWDATMDGLNWDLPNDGIGNSKNAKSLRDIHDGRAPTLRSVLTNREPVRRHGRVEGLCQVEVLGARRMVPQ